MHIYIYIYISKIYKIYKIYKINTKRPGPAQARPKPGAAHGPDRDRAAPGLGRAGPASVLCIYLAYLKHI